MGSGIEASFNSPIKTKCEGEQIVPYIARKSPVEKSYCEKEVNGTPSLDVDNER